MRIEIINTGSELMLGRILNTHQQFLCRRLADLGCAVERQICVSDRGEDIEQAVREALSRADLIITTGGLGPTSDDRTRDRIAALLGKKLIVDEAVLGRIKDWFCGRNRPMVQSTAVQAEVPEGATVLLNNHGTAPGLVIEVPAGLFRPVASSLVMLPGPPRELRPMFDKQVLPWLRERVSEPGFICRTLRTCGLGESWVEEKIAGPLQPLVDQGLELGYCARTGEVDVRFAASGRQSATLLADAERMTRELLGDAIFGAEEDTLEQVVVRLLTERNQRVALAESCTGGFISHRLTNVAGASAVVWGGCVTYANEAKMRLLGVDEQTLKTHGAVSEQTARQMAEGALRVSNANYAMAVTGIAGPAGGTEEKPRGTVFIALATRSDTTVQRHLNTYDRETFKFVTAQQSLDLLRRAILRGQ